MAKTIAHKVKDDLVMTLDSDDEEVAGPSSPRLVDDDQIDARAMGNGHASTSTGAKPKASLAHREKVMTTTKKGKQAKRTSTTAGEDAEPALDAAFTFDLEPGMGSRDFNGAWDFSVKGAKGQGGISVDDIIERRRKANPIAMTNKAEEEGDKDKLAFSSFQEEDEEEDDEEDDDEESEADSLEFGAGALARVGQMTSDDEEEDEDEEDPLDDEDEEEDEEMDDNDDTAPDHSDSESEMESDAESETEKAKKAAFFAEESDLGRKGTASKMPLQTFESFQLSRPILRGIASLGYNTPTGIQSQSIPIALAGKDIVGGAQTGSGKTAAFLIPILERLVHRPKGRQDAKSRVLILMPTRELATQCIGVGRHLAQFTDITFCLCIGGVSIKLQESQLRQRPDIIIATPGRLIDHIRNSAAFGIDDVEILVMDEADQMLAEGFKAELDEIIKSAPKSRQTMLFSATMTDDVDELVRLSMRRPVRLFVDPERAVVKQLIQEFVRVRGSTTVSASSRRRSQEDVRAALLLHLCMRTFTQQVIIFVRSKKLAHQLRIIFGLVGLSAGELHGDLTQEQRLQSLQAFRDGKVDFLLATDLASRGLDIKGVETVINYDMPAQLEMYLHRVGRTARAGRGGRSVTLVGEQDRKLLKAVLKKTSAEQVRHRLVPSEGVTEMADKIVALHDEVEAILREEKEEKLLRNAEMEVKKGENLVNHREDIMSRPRRTWFVGQDTKAAQKNIAKLEYEAKMGGNTKTGGAAKRDKYAGLSRKQKRSKMAREEMENEGRQQVGAINASIRAAKRSARPKDLGTVETSKKKGRQSAKTARSKGGGQGGARKSKSSSQPSGKAGLKHGKRGSQQGNTRKGKPGGRRK